MKTPCIASAQDITEMEAESTTALPQSERHKDFTTARQGKDMADSCELSEFIESRNPLNCSLQSIATGINGGSSVTWKPQNM